MLLFALLVYRLSITPILIFERTLLAGEFFLVTGSGKYFRNIAVDPEACLAIIELDDKGVNYRIRWGLVEGGRPTSELPTHLMNHEVKKKLTNGRHRVI